VTMQEERRDIESLVIELLDDWLAYHRSFDDWLESFRGTQTVEGRIGLLHTILDNGRIEDPEAVEFLLHCADRHSYKCIVVGEDVKKSAPARIRAKAVNVIATQLLHLDKLGCSDKWIPAIVADLLLLPLLFRVLIQIHEDDLKRPQYNKPVQAFLNACDFGLMFGLEHRVDKYKYREFMETQRMAFYMAAFLWGAHEDVVPCLNTSPEIRQVLLRLALGYGMESMEVLDAFAQAIERDEEPLRQLIVKHLAAAEQIAEEKKVFDQATK
jgi:hypothetical protein